MGLPSSIYGNPRLQGFKALFYSSLISYSLFIPYYRGRPVTVLSNAISHSSSLRSLIYDAKEHLRTLRTLKNA